MGSRDDVGRCRPARAGGLEQEVSQSANLRQTHFTSGTLVSMFQLLGGLAILGIVGYMVIVMVANLLSLILHLL